MFGKAVGLLVKWKGTSPFQSGWNVEIIAKSGQMVGIIWKEWVKKNTSWVNY